MSTIEAASAKMPADLGMVIEQVHDSAIPLTKTLDYVLKRMQDRDAPQSELRAWATTRDLLAAAAGRYASVTAVLHGGKPQDVRIDTGVDAEALSRYLRGLEQILAGWKMLVTGKWNATNETAAIWTEVLARGGTLSPENEHMFSDFAAERRDLESAGSRIRLALEYLWRNGRPRPSDAS